MLVMNRGLEWALTKVRLSDTALFRDFTPLLACEMEQSGMIDYHQSGRYIFKLTKKCPGLHCDPLVIPDNIASSNWFIISLICSITDYGT